MYQICCTSFGGDESGSIAATGKLYGDVISGGSGSKGTVKNEGKIDIPAFVWKVAVIMDHNKGLADVHSVSDLQVIAIIMPNDPTINSDWTTYKTTVDAVEALSSLMEPIIMVVLGTLIGGMVVAMYLPIFKLGGAV